MGAAFDRGRGHASGRHGARPVLLHPADPRADRGRRVERRRSRLGRGVQSRGFPDRCPRRPLAAPPHGGGPVAAGVPVDHARLPRRQYRAGGRGLAGLLALRRWDHYGPDDGLRAHDRHPPRTAGPLGHRDRDRLYGCRHRDPRLGRAGAVARPAQPRRSVVGARAVRGAGRRGGSLGMAGGGTGEIGTERSSSNRVSVRAPPRSG